MATQRVSIKHMPISEWKMRLRLFPRVLSRAVYASTHSDAVPINRSHSQWIGFQHFLQTHTINYRLSPNFKVFVISCKCFLKVRFSPKYYVEEFWLEVTTWVDHTRREQCLWLFRKLYPQDFLISGTMSNHNIHILPELRKKVSSSAKDRTSRGVNRLRLPHWTTTRRHSVSMAYITTLMPIID